MFMTMEKRKVRYAKESSKTSKAREKLKKRLSSIERKVTPDALKKTRLEIHKWIARHAHNRVILRDKNISLFDENQNTAELSQKVAGLAQKIRLKADSVQKRATSLEDLKSRIC